MNDELEQCVAFFRSKPQYKRIMQCIYKNFVSYGGPSGNVIIKDASAEECNAANGIITPKRPYSPPLLKFRLSDFERGLSNTRFGSVSLQQLTEAYFNTRIVGSKEKKLNREQLRQSFQENILLKSKGGISEKWFREMFSSQNYGYRSVMAEYKISPEKAETLMLYLKDALEISYESSLPVQLAVLSARITGNPHYFDKSNTAGRLLLQGMSCISGIMQTGASETEKEIYAAFNIEPDNISGAAAAVGVRLFDENHKEHPGYGYFADNGEVCLISVSGLSKIRYADCDRKTAYIVENPMVFSALSDIAAESNVCLICTFGQIKYSGLKLIDMLAKSGCRIFYSGDFDPEGLQIADKLISRNSCIIPWHMSVDDYISLEKSDTISEKRIKILESISNPILKKTAEAILSSGKSAYQELLIENLAKDIIKINPE